MEAAVPILRIYSRCTGETLRNAAALRSSGASEGERPAAGDTMQGAYSALGIRRRRFSR